MRHSVSYLHALSLSFDGAQLSLVAARGTLLPLGLAVATYVHAAQCACNFLDACCMPRKKGGAVRAQ